jgi:S1-C subfamily serine protease
MVTGAKGQGRGDGGSRSRRYNLRDEWRIAIRARSVMRIDRGAGSWFRQVILIAVIALVAFIAVPAQATTLDELISAVVRVKTFINPDGTSVSNLGREREGSGIVIDESGLVLTIGYLMVEAHAIEIVTNSGRTLPAAVVGYDPETGFGLLRTLEPPMIKPLAFGHSADVKERDPALVASFGGADSVLPVHVASRREFAGGWEYLIDGAIFTSPPHQMWSGAALISRAGKLIGVGSLIVGDANGDNDPSPGNMFVPIDLLEPILGDLIAKGRAAGAGRPWLGLVARAVHGQLLVGRVAPGSPAEKAGLQRGDVIAGVNGEKTRTLSAFYRKVWALGAAGVTVPLDVMSESEPRRVEVNSVNRLDMLKLPSTF